MTPSNLTGVPTKIKRWPDNILYRETHLFAELKLNRNGFKNMQQRAAAIPRRSRTDADYVIPLQRADGNEMDVRKIQIAREFLEIRTDVREYLLAVVNEVHFIHGNNNVRDRKQRSDKRMPARLRQNTFARVDQNDGS